MNISIAMMVLSMVGTSGPIPTEPGTKWKFETRERGKPVMQEWEIVTLPDDFSAWLMDEGGKKQSFTSTKITGETPGFVGIEIDGKLRFLLKSGKTGQRLYSNGGWEGTYAIAFTLPRILKDGSTWQSAHSRFSCGWGVIPVSAHATPKKWASAPWDPKGRPSTGFRIEGSSSIVVVPGVGIVEMDLVNGMDHFDLVRVK